MQINSRSDKVGVKDVDLSDNTVGAADYIDVDGRFLHRRRVFQTVQESAIDVAKSGYLSETEQEQVQRRRLRESRQICRGYPLRVQIFYKNYSARKCFTLKIKFKFTE